MPVYHICIADQVVGPLSEAEVKARVAAGEINADTLVSTDGGAWARLAETLPAQNRAAAQVSLPPMDAVMNPYSPPMAHIAAPVATPLRHYGGIGRLLFLVGFVAAVILGGLIGSTLRLGEREAYYLMLGLILIPACFRFKNIGRPPFWCLLLFVPVLGVFVMLPCFALPEGYQHHRKLDLWAKLLGLLFIACIVGLAIWAGLTIMDP